MTRATVIAVFLIGGLLASVVQAAQVTIDLEEFAGTVQTFQPVDPVVTSKGYTLSFGGDNPLGDGVWVTDQSTFGDAVFFAVLPDSAVTLMPQSGQAFDLLGFSYAFSGGGNPNPPATLAVTIAFTTLAGQNNLTTLNLNSEAQSDGDFLATGQFDNIASLTIFAPNTVLSDGRALGLDNFIVATVVPVPAAVWLFGSALAGLGWLRRKQPV